MSFKRTVCLFVLLVCIIPSFALAAKNYDSNKIYSGEVSIKDVVFKAGDKITGGNGISVTVYYADAAGQKIDEGKGSVKSVTIDGEKVSEWVMTGISGSVIQLGNTISQAAYGFTLKPAYTAADGEGYYMLSAKTYSVYCDAAKGKDKKVKLTGRVVAVEADYMMVSIDDNIHVAIRTDETVNAEDRINCKGTIVEYMDYNGTSIPVIEGTEMTILQYEPLQKGDKGADVLAMKERLRTLGYFSASAELSNTYNDTCVERVQMFQNNNGLPATGIADAETLTLLYSDAAKSK